MGFTAPPEKVSFDGLMFDMDGTIIDSTQAVIKSWHTVGAELGVDPEVILKTAHGRRSIDTLKIIAPEKANWEYVGQMEGLLPKLHGDDATDIPGARALLESLISVDAPWTIVTSGSLPLVKGWLDVLKLAPPNHLVTAESVERGKPDPACYRLGREKLNLGFDARAVVIEDSPAGIRSGKDAGCDVIGLVTTHTLEQVLAAEPDWILQDLQSAKMVDYTDGVVTLQISDAWLH